MAKPPFDAERIAFEILYHIDTMYPQMWGAVPASARVSIKNTIIRQIKNEEQYITEREQEADNGKKAEG